MVVRLSIACSSSRVTYCIAVGIHALGVEVACYLECKTVVVSIAQILQYVGVDAACRYCNALLRVGCGKAHNVAVDAHLHCR